MPDLETYVLTKAPERFAFDHHTTSLDIQAVLGKGNTGDTLRDAGTTPRTHFTTLLRPLS